MKISQITNNVNFGLKIVENDDLKRFVGFQSVRGKSGKEISGYFDRISKLHNDDLSLEFLNYEELNTVVFGKAPFCNLRLFGNMKSDNGSVFVDKTSEYKHVLSSEYHLSLFLSAFIKSVQDSVNQKDNL